MPDPIQFHLLACLCGDLTLVEAGAEAPATCRRCRRPLCAIGGTDLVGFDPQVDRCHLVRRPHPRATTGTAWVRCPDCGRASQAPLALATFLRCPFCGDMTVRIDARSVSIDETVAILHVHHRAQGVTP